MNVAVARVHMQRHEHPAAQHAFMNDFHLCKHRHECIAGKNAVQRRAHLGFPRSAERVILQDVDDADVTVDETRRSNSPIKCVSPSGDSSKRAAANGVSRWFNK